MEKSEFEYLELVYKPFINRLFSENLKYCFYISEINYGFINKVDDGIMATCNRKTNFIAINSESFLIRYFRKDYREIEYLLMHEVRHIFQHDEVQRLNNGENTILDKAIAERWNYEFHNYIRALDKDNKENPQYFKQDSEMDAFAFAFAIMKHKYGCKIEDFYSAMKYGTEFDSIVEDWIKNFNELEA